MSIIDDLKDEISNYAEEHSCDFERAIQKYLEDNGFTIFEMDDFDEVFLNYTRLEICRELEYSRSQFAGHHLFSRYFNLNDCWIFKSPNSDEWGSCNELSDMVSDKDDFIEYLFKFGFSVMGQE